MGQNGLLFSGQLSPRDTSSALGAYMSFVARSRHPFTLHSLRIGGYTFSPPRTWMRIWFSSSTPNHYDILPRTCCRQHFTLRHVFIMPIPFPRNKRSRGLPKILNQQSSSGFFIKVVVPYFIGICIYAFGLGVRYCALGEFEVKI